MKCEGSFTMTEPSLPEESLFAQALEIESSAERVAFLDRSCGNNPALRAEVEALLRAHERSGDLLDLPENAAVTTDLPAGEGPGTAIGPYKLLEQIGEGGMGTVWMAQQTKPVKRLVAVKLIKPGMDSKQVLARFDAERQALALMDHPNIAKVFDAAATATGRPYFVMELVKGVPLTKYCDEHRLTPKERLELFVPVCQAIQHAHQKGIIHRDIKPSNVLVALYDGKPVPKVIDFGIAKAAGQTLTEKTLVTGFGAVVGTLEYMSPEQAELNQLDIDTRSDIYSLGILLYELLTGSTPLERKRLQQAAMLEVLRLIREEEPPRPSTRLSTTDELPSVAANRGLEPKKLSGLVRGELDWIVMKALDKDRNRRYETANGFAQDVQRYLADEPVQACPPSASYRFRKFVRRHRGPVLAATVILLLLIGGILGTSLGLLQARTSEQRAESAAIKAGEERDAANAARTAEKVQRERAEDLGKELRRKLYVADMNMAGEAAASSLGLSSSGLGRVAELVSHWRADQTDLRGWEWYYLYGLCHQDLVTFSPYPDSPGSAVFSIAWSPDGMRLATSGSYFAGPMIWDAATGKQAVVLELGFFKNGSYQGAHDSGIAWSPDGSQLAAVHRAPPNALGTLGYDRNLTVWDTRTGKRRFTVTLGAPAYFNNSIAWAPDGTRLAVPIDQEVQLLDAGTGKLDRVLKGHAASVTLVVWSHDGKRLASEDRQANLKIWDVAAGKATLDFKTNSFDNRALSWSPDDRRLVSGGSMGRLEFWDTASGKRLVEGDAYAQIFCVAWSPDGTRLAFGTDRAEVTVADAATGKALSILRGHSDSVVCVAWSPDGTRLASVGWDGAVKVWDANQPNHFPRSRRTGWRPFPVRGSAAVPVNAVSWSPDGKRLAAADRDGAVKVTNLAARGGAAALDDTKTFREHARGKCVVSWNPHGTRLASSDDAAIQIWDAATGKELVTLKGSEEVQWLAWSPDGTRLASAGRGGTVIIWDPVTRGQIRSFRRSHPTTSDPVSSVTWSPDGVQLAAAFWEGVVVIWDTTTGQSTCTLKGHKDFVHSVAWRPTGTWLASAGRDRTILVWDASTGKVLCTLKGHTQWVDQISWSPDGKRLASCSDDKTVKIWDPITGEALITFPFLPTVGQGLPDLPRCLDWSSDGSCLAVGCDSGAIESFAAAAGYRLAGRPEARKEE
jgi:WD40 repeat protein/serine/threonine protein kinase